MSVLDADSISGELQAQFTACATQSDVLRIGGINDDHPSGAFVVIEDQDAERQIHWQVAHDSSGIDLALTLTHGLIARAGIKQVMPEVATIYMGSSQKTENKAR